MGMMMSIKGRQSLQPPQGGDNELRMHNLEQKLVEQVPLDATDRRGER
jgi:hypothetical protein